MARRRLSTLLPVTVAALVLAAAQAAVAATALTTELVVSGLVDPLYLTAAPLDRDRVFIIEQAGVIRILDVSTPTAVLLTTPFLDLTALVEDTGNEQGLLGMAFHPDYWTNGFVYVNYTDLSGDTVVSRFHVPNSTPNEADSNSEVILLTITQPQVNHNGGWLSFGPSDGYLYIATGDGGGHNDDETGHTVGVGNGQDTTDNLLGKMLRIDVDGTDGPGGNYGIPSDNPFVGVTGDDEIWAYGLRNPWRNSFDSVTGDLYIADVGEASWEEIDYQLASSTGGDNWGWRCREGANNFNFSGGCSSSFLLDPIEEYSHGGSPFRCSITGGELYRGCAVPDLQGTYFYADFCSDQIWSFKVVGGSVTAAQERTTELAPTGTVLENITSFGLDSRGELYILDRDGEIYRVIPDGVASACPVDVPSTSWLGPGVLVLGLALAAVFAMRSGWRPVFGA